MATLPALMDELASVILNAFVLVEDIDVQVYPRLVVNASPPTIDIYPADTPRDDDTAGYGDLAGAYLLTVRARVSTADNEAGQDFLLALMDDDDDLCLARAVEDDYTLNGLAAYVDVVGRTGMVVYPDTGGEGSLVGCQWTVRVINTVT